MGLIWYPNETKIRPCVLIWQSSWRLTGVLLTWNCGGSSLWLCLLQHKMNFRARSTDSVFKGFGRLIVNGKYSNERVPNDWVAFCLRHSPHYLMWYWIYWKWYTQLMLYIRHIMDNFRFPSQYIGPNVGAYNPFILFLIHILVLLPLGELIRKFIIHFQDQSAISVDDTLKLIACRYFDSSHPSN